MRIVPALTLAAISAVFADLAAAASTALLGQVALDGRQVPLYRIEDVVEPADSMDDFAVSLAYRLREFTAEQGVEACASICRAPGDSRWGATLLTIQSHAACPMTEVCPDGFSPTGVDIHSHIHASSFRPSDVDRLFIAGGDRRAGRVLTDPMRFSPGDFRSGPGYLVTREDLQFQQGSGNVRKVWDMTRLAPPIPNPAVCRATVFAPLPSPLSCRAIAASGMH